MANDIIFQDNSAMVIQEFERCIRNGLEAIGMKAVADVQKKTPVGTAQTTGIEGYSTNGLSQSITYKVVDNTVYVGTNKTTKNKVVDKETGKEKEVEVPYPIYVEFGTGIYADNGQGRQSPWGWTDKNGDEHWTRGMKPQHMFKNGISENIAKYERIMKNELENG